MVGRRFREGVDLSGGEWQKIGLARAYMRDADLLILDEPTSALDARAEYEVFVRFKELTVGKTAVVISHRFSTVRMADRILVLGDGRVLESGTHDDLLALGGPLRRTVRVAGGGVPVGAGRGIPGAPRTPRSTTNAAETPHAASLHRPPSTRRHPASTPPPSLRDTSPARGGGWRSGSA